MSAKKLSILYNTGRSAEEVMEELARPSMTDYRDAWYRRYFTPTVDGE